MANFKQLRDDSRIIDLKPVRPPVLWPAVKRFFRSWLVDYGLAGSTVLLMLL
jgi:hypothetical protein